MIVNIIKNSFKYLAHSELDNTNFLFFFLLNFLIFNLSSFFINDTKIFMK